MTESPTPPPLTPEQTAAALAEVERHAHLRRDSKHAMAMALQSGDPKKIEEQRIIFAAAMKEVADSTHTQADIDAAAQAHLDAIGYVPPKES